VIRRAKHRSSDFDPTRFSHRVLFKPAVTLAIEYARTVVHNQNHSPRENQTTTELPDALRTAHRAHITKGC
jgi:hypothetical protein